MLMKIVEISQPMTSAMLQIQARLLVLINLCLHEVQRACKLPIENVSMDNILLKQFDSLIMGHLAVENERKHEMCCDSNSHHNIDVIR